MQPACQRATNWLHGLASRHDDWSQKSAAFVWLQFLLELLIFAAVQVIAMETTPVAELSAVRPDEVRRTFSALLGVAALAFHLYSRAVRGFLVPNVHTSRAIRLVLKLYVLHLHAPPMLQKC
jgi:hypothetical protein